jgi:hypothetical protein
MTTRECGPCQACCTVLRIEAIQKPRATRCPNQCATGCAIYPDRPAECAGYRCAYLQGLVSKRPDESGVVVHVTKDERLADLVGSREKRVFFAHVLERGSVPMVLWDWRDLAVSRGQAFAVMYDRTMAVYGPKGRAVVDRS